MRRWVHPYGCAGKEQFTRERAVAVARKMNRRHADDPVSAYKCRSCSAYHVGSTPQWKGHVRRRRGPLPIRGETEWELEELVGVGCPTGEPE